MSALTAVDEICTVTLLIQDLLHDLMRHAQTCIQREGKDISHKEKLKLLELVMISLRSMERPAQIRIQDSAICVMHDCG